jgi:hypothetical protein
MAITNQGLHAAKAKGVKLDGTTAKSIENQNAAAERAEALRPMFAELAGKSHRAIAAELKAHGPDAGRGIVGPEPTHRRKSDGRLQLLGAGGRRIARMTARVLLRQQLPSGS